MSEPDPARTAIVSGGCDPLRLQNLATQTALQVVPPTDASAFTFTLRWIDDQLTLRQRAHGNKKATEIQVDFSAGAADYRRRRGGGFGEPVCRAAGARPASLPLVYDATAGLGRDAFVLASVGCSVILFERSPIVHALLQDGLRRAALHGETADIVGRMQLLRRDSLDALRSSDTKPPDVVYLDPMYPASPKSAAAKKEMTTLRGLLEADRMNHTAELDQLLIAARQRAGKRVVLKRPLHSASIGKQPPSGSITSGKTRFDIYPPGN